MRPHALLLAIATVIVGGSCRPAVPDEAPPPEPVAPRPASAEPGPIAYRLSPVLDGDALVALRVELRFVADDSGTTRVRLPQEWASERELWRYLRDVEVEGARAVTEDGPALRVIESEPGASLRMSYLVVSAYDREPRTDDGQPFAPIVRPTWFHAFGESLFASLDEQDERPATFEWDGGSTGLRLASDLQHLEAVGGTVSDVRESIVLGGRELAVLEEVVDGAPLRMAILGEYGFSHQAFFDMARTIVRAERELWGEPGGPFTITVAPLTPLEHQRSLGGTGRSDAFALTISQDTPIEPLRHLLAHEYFHTWNPRLLGGQPRGEEEEMRGKWFAEGFTELYTWRLLLRSGLYRLEDFVDDWNAALLDYASSPVRNEPNSRIVVDYWNDPDVGQLPYLRGPLLGALWERSLREATDGARGLDDVLLAMRAIHREADEPSRLPDAAGLFVTTYQELGGPALGPQLERFVERGETIILPQDVLGGCLRLETDTEGAVPVQRLRIVGASTPEERQACARVVSGRGTSAR
ncbi:MAG: hypothetical protein KC501_22065 [Myxococcales bacterium]|nr:hypothetical protein [Myxococcales bacterium]